MTENEKIELFDKWYDENYDEWAEGEEGIALREELEQAFKGGIAELEKENAELRKVAEFQQSSNINKYFENKKLKEGLAVGSTFNKALNSMNKTLKEERDKYRNMVFDKDEQLTNAKEILQEFVEWATWQGSNCPNFKSIQDKAEAFLNSEVEK